MKWLCNSRFLIVLTILVIFVIIFMTSSRIQNFLFGHEGFSGLNTNIVPIWEDTNFKDTWKHTYPGWNTFPLNRIIGMDGKPFDNQNCSVSFWIYVNRPAKNWNHIISIRSSRVDRYLGIWMRPHRPAFHIRNYLENENGSVNTNSGENWSNETGTYNQNKETNHFAYNRSLFVTVTLETPKPSAYQLEANPDKRFDSIYTLYINGEFKNSYVHKGTVKDADGNNAYIMVGRKFKSRNYKNYLMKDLKLYNGAINQTDAENLFRAVSSKSDPEGARTFFNNNSTEGFRTKSTLEGFETTSQKVLIMPEYKDIFDFYKQPLIYADGKPCKYNGDTALEPRGYTEEKDDKREYEVIKQVHKYEADARDECNKLDDCVAIGLPKSGQEGFSFLDKIRPYCSYDQVVRISDKMLSSTKTQTECEKEEKCKVPHRYQHRIRKIEPCTLSQKNWIKSLPYGLTLEQAEKKQNCRIAPYDSFDLLKHGSGKKSSDYGSIMLKNDYEKNFKCGERPICVDYQPGEGAIRGTGQYGICGKEKTPDFEILDFAKDLPGVFEHNANKKMRYVVFDSNANLREGTRAEGSDTREEASDTTNPKHLTRMDITDLKIKLGGNGITFCLWVNVQANKRIESDWSRVFEFGNGFQTDVITVTVHGRSLKCRVKNGARGENSDDGEYTIITQNVDDNQWNHISWVIGKPYDKQRCTWTLYINGTVTQELTDKAYPSDIERNKMYIGACNHWWGPHFSGSVGDFRIYKEPLTTEQVVHVLNNPDPDGQ